MRNIKEGSEMIGSLEVDLIKLNEARQSYYASQSTLIDYINQAESARNGTNDISINMLEIEKKAKLIIASAQAAGAAQTSIGLGKEFENRALSLQTNLKWLSVALVFVLVISGLISFFRLKEIHNVIDIKPLSLPLVWANVIAMFASLGPPVWLAWLITRQIGQRFRLAEDYNFKASVAKAYAGYREEAGRLNDVEFERRLFETTIRKIEEEPLRHIDKENESSPIHNLINKLRFRNVDTGAIISAISAMNKEK